jgi:hypothetical protein
MESRQWSRPISPTLRLALRLQCLLTLYWVSIQGLSRVYPGSIQALFRLYSDFLEALLSLWWESVNDLFCRHFVNALLPLYYLLSNTSNTHTHTRTHAHTHTHTCSRAAVSTKVCVFCNSFPFCNRFETMTRDIHTNMSRPRRRICELYIQTHTHTHTCDNTHHHTHTHAHT